MAKRTAPNFRTKKQHRAGKTLRITLAFFISVLIFASLSFLYMLHTYDYDPSKILNKREETTQPAQKNPPPQAVEGQTAFLLALTGQNDKLLCTALVYADVTQRTLYICTLSPAQTVLCEGQTVSLEKHLQTGGMPRLSAAVQAKYGCTAERYIAIESSDFRDLVQSLGSIHLMVRERIDYHSSDLTLLLVKGEQSLRADILLKYLQYQATRGTEGLDAQAEVIYAMLEQYFTEENVQKGETLYRLVINLVKSNITAYDFVSNLKALQYLSWKDEPLKLQIVSDPSVFPSRETGGAAS